MNSMYSFIGFTIFHFKRFYIKIAYIYKVVKYNIVNPTSREDLKGCTLHKSKPLEYQTKGTIYKRGLFTGD